MKIIALFIGFAYGYVSVKGQFCMNSGFSNVVRIGDTTKIKSYLLAILIQMMILPLLFVGLYLNSNTSYLVQSIGLPPLVFVGSAIGGFLFGICMHYTAGCGAGIFYKIGEKNSGAILAVIGFAAGIYLMEMGILNHFKNYIQELGSSHQQPVWKSESPILVAILIVAISGIILFLLLRQKDNKPRNASWGWKRTGISIGIIGTAGWVIALIVSTSYSLAIIPGVMDMMSFKYSWGLLFVLGIPIGAYFNTSNKSEKQFMLPKPNIAAKRLFGGLGLGISGSIAGGCTVGHGLTFTPLLGIGSLVATLFIFLGSGMVGYLTRK
ncbi:MAG: putative membrane protein YedE/YeeE [Saprospiraceae bacterium]|jgi:uncharacterized membrane protein YedE/YeeE